jgi:hypothetical protein
VHTLFEVGAKLLGIYFAYLGLLSAVGTAITTTEYLRQDPMTSGVFIVFGVVVLVQLALGCVLFFKTSWVRCLARLPERDLPALNLDSALPLGLVLSGLQSWGGSPGLFCADLFLLFFLGVLRRHLEPAQRLGPSAGRGIGVGLILRAERLAAWVGRAQRG